MELKRTIQQNKALHKFFELVSKELIQAGITDMRVVLKPEIEIPVSPYMVKEFMWKPIQKIYTGKNSTTKLDRYSEINQIYDIFNKHLGEKFGQMGVEFIPFPSLEELEKQL
jgi:hypothetical protein